MMEKPVICNPTGIEVIKGKNYNSILSLLDEANERVGELQQSANYQILPTGKGILNAGL